MSYDNELDCGYDRDDPKHPGWADAMADKADMDRKRMKEDEAFAADLRARESVSCPDCKQGRIVRGDRCDHCGLSWEALEDAAQFWTNHEAGKEGGL